jgi:uncharacterized phage-associated protein
MPLEFPQGFAAGLKYRQNIFVIYWPQRGHLVPKVDRDPPKPPPGGAKMPTVFDIADYFLAKTDPDLGDLMTPMKLQKLVYYAQGFHLAIYNKPLFTEQIEAWDHGPVCPALYRKYKGRKPITPNKTLAEAVGQFTKRQKELLEDVYTTYGCFAAWYLREISHQDTAWQNAYPGGVISCEALKESCTARLNA